MKHGKIVSRELGLTAVEIHENGEHLMTRFVAYSRHEAMQELASWREERGFSCTDEEFGDEAGEWPVSAELHRGRHWIDSTGYLWSEHEVYSLKRGVALKFVGECVEATWDRERRVVSVADFESPEDLFESIRPKGMLRPCEVSSRDCILGDGALYHPGCWGDGWIDESDVHDISQSESQHHSCDGCGDWLEEGHGDTDSCSECFLWVAEDATYSGDAETLIAGLSAFLYELDADNPAHNDLVIKVAGEIAAKHQWARDFERALESAIDDGFECPVIPALEDGPEFAHREVWLDIACEWATLGPDAQLELLGAWREGRAALREPALRLGISLRMAELFVASCRA